MAFNAYNKDSMSTLATDTSRTTVKAIKLSFGGLRPNTKHKMYLDGVDYTWACKGFGQNLGEDILSDENGQVNVTVLYEIPYSFPSNYELPTGNPISDIRNSVGAQNSRESRRIYQDYKTWTIRSLDGLSEAHHQRRFDIVLVDGDYNKIERPRPV